MSNTTNPAPLPTAEWDTSLAPILEHMQNKPLNVHALMAHHPALLKSWWTFRNHVVTGGDLGRRRAELIILRVACQMKSWYEWASHVERALACGLSMDEIERVKQGSWAEGWDAAERLLLLAVEELQDNNAITPETLNALSQHFSLKQILDLIAIRGMYVILGGLLNSLGLDLDETIKSRLPASVNREQFELEFPPN